MEKATQVQTLDAIFINGVFQPLNPKEISIVEGQKVRIVVEPLNTSENAIDLATSVYKDLSEEQIDDIEKITQPRRFL